MFSFGRAKVNKSTDFVCTLPACPRKRFRHAGGSVTRSLAMADLVRHFMSSATVREEIASLLRSSQ